MQKRELQPEQAAAAYELARHISVTAGPGSGKTTVLVERYLHILRSQKLSIDQIVAITFTNRAANEMRERLRSRLNQILQTASGEERKRWLNYKRTLDGAVITTIHGFCARLLREFPVEARVDPQFTLLDEHRAQMLLEVTVEQVLTEFLSSNHAEISRLTLGVGRGRLADGLAHIYREVRGQGLSFADLKTKTEQSHATELHYQQSLDELSQTMNDFLFVRRTTAATRANHAEVSSSWPALQKIVNTAPEHEDLADYCRAVEGFRKLRPQARGEFKEHIQALDALVWEKDLLGRVPQTCLDLFAKRYALELISLVTRIDQRLNQEKQQLSALDFDDLELRALELLARPEVIARTSERYKFFLVDEFQDTNNVQRQLLERLALRPAQRDSANLFIVGDRKQSIYGFRGADVDVFREMTGTLTAAGGQEKSLQLNFRSQPPLVNFFNHLFQRLFQPKEEVTAAERAQLGYVEHEPSEAKRELRDSGPLVDLLITTESSGDDDDPKLDQSSRELDAEQLARRIIALTETGTAVTGTAGVPPASSDAFAQVTAESSHPSNSAFNDSGRDARGPSNSDPGNNDPSVITPTVKYSDIALLFRAMTNVGVYESVFRRANIPYQTVLGRGFYEREEITDLIQLLRFLDNKTDELALAAVLRSPLCGISDNALLALRCAPWLDELETTDPLLHFSQTRNLFHALKRHADVAFIGTEEHELLERAANLIKGLIARRHNYGIGSLLRYAVEQSEFMTVIAANFDGAQRLANVQRLFTLAERFERSGAHLIRDFVRYVEEFEAIGSRESEGQIDEATNAVRLMTIHQAKGLEFPIVIIPELQRYSRVPDNWFLLDRHRGLTLKVPDGRGKLVAGCTFKSFEARQALREQFESMRLMYVAATRAQDRLMFSGTVKSLSDLKYRKGFWLAEIWQALGFQDTARTGIHTVGERNLIRLVINSEGIQATPTTRDPTAASVDEGVQSIQEMFPLLQPVLTSDASVHRFSVTQLINYQRCPRQYYFDRVLHLPSADQMAVWNDAEAPEPPANLTATLKGAVIHRFCETYEKKDDTRELLRQSFADVLRLRQAELGDRLMEIDTEVAVAELLPLAEHYLTSGVFERVEQARAASGSLTSADGSQSNEPTRFPSGEVGLWSEVPFRLRRPLGILTGAIDKLLVVPAADGNCFDVEIIDFKTNRMRASSSSLGPRASRPQTLVEDSAQLNEASEMRAGRPRSQYLRSKKGVDQFAFDFKPTPVETEVVADPLSVDDQVQLAASDYQLQMQAYALAVSDLLPSLSEKGGVIKVTLHFLDPNVEFHLEPELLSRDACARAIDAAMMDIVASHEPAEFPVRPELHCRRCSFLDICGPGGKFLASISSRSKTEDSLQFLP